MAARIAALKAMAFQGERIEMSHSRIGVISVGISTIGMVWLSAQTPRPDADRIRGFSMTRRAPLELERERELKALAVREGRRGRLRRHDRGAASHRVAVRDQASPTTSSIAVQGVRHRGAKYEYSVLLPWPGAAPHRHRRARPGEAGGRGREDSAAISGPTSRASSRPTTPTRRPATSPARSST